MSAETPDALAALRDIAAAGAEHSVVMVSEPR
jgi:hypothetical protein